MSRASCCCAVNVCADAGAANARRSATRERAAAPIAAAAFENVWRMHASKRTIETAWAMATSLPDGTYRGFERATPASGCDYALFWRSPLRRAKPERPALDHVGLAGVR